MVGEIERWGVRRRMRESGRRDRERKRKSGRRDRERGRRDSERAVGEIKIRSLDRERNKERVVGEIEREKGREILCYPQCTDLAVKALSIGGTRQILTVEHRDNQVNRDRDDRKNDRVGLEIERYREKEIETESLRECIREKK